MKPGNLNINTSYKSDEDRTGGEIFGHDFAKGVFSYIGKLCLILMAIVITFNLARAAFGWGLDDTDRDGWHRSGLRLYVDHKTGVEYVATPEGALTPRLAAPASQP